MSMWYGGLSCLSLMGISKKTKKKLALYKNAIAFQNTFSRLLLDGLNRYYFEGLPETVSERVLKQSLVWYGGAVFFERSGSMMCLPGVPDGTGFNVYGDVGKCWVWGANGFNKSIPVYIPGSDESTFLRKEITGARADKDARGVYVWENELRFPFINIIMFYSEAISDTMRTLDVCRKNIKSPYFIVCEESVKPTVERYLQQRDDNEDAVLSTGVFDATKVNILPIQTNGENLNSCIQLIEWYENQFRMLCGIENNGNMDKKGENLIQAEIDITNDYTNFSVEKSVKFIQERLDDVNKIFGTDIKIVKREVSDNVYISEKQEAEDIPTDKE